MRWSNAMAQSLRQPIANKFAPPADPSGIDLSAAARARLQ